MKILFVCLGNICRSPMAEAVMQAVAARRGCAIECDSAGIIDYHQGELADPRMRAHAARRGYTLIHRSRPVVPSDFEHFDLIIAMDSTNVRALQSMPGAQVEKIRLATDFCTRFSYATSVPDPYYGGDSGFEQVIDLLEDACEGLAQAIENGEI